ncbi:MAG: M20/M25/M40 family metallo-hydrolase, partial [Terriglobales bacterium]
MIKRLLAVALLSCWLLPAAAQSPAELARLSGALLAGGRAYEYDRQLADGIGPRLTGSANYEKAAAWAMAQFTALGLTHVRREPWTLPDAWQPDGPATARMLQPHPQALHLVSEGWSPSTPPGGVRGPVLYLADVRPGEVRAAARQIAGAIVLLDEASLRAAFAAGQGTLFDGLRMIGQAGARGLIFGVGSENNASNMFGDTGFSGTVANLPASNLGLEDTLLLRRLLPAGPVQVEFSFHNQIRHNIAVENVVGEIPGGDVRAGYVLVAAHLDSWQAGTGAQDDGTGVASLLALAQALRSTGIVPRRTIRFALFGGEEEGLLGSRAYVRRHRDELADCAAVLITDNGGGAPSGWFTMARPDADAALAALVPELKALDAGQTSPGSNFAFSADSGPFLVSGVPSFLLSAPMGPYLRIHHQPADTFDKVNERDLGISAAVFGVTALGLA